MGINLVIAVTDGDWFNMLRQQTNLAEVNFWAPSAASFRALQPGELFLFKLHAPHNAVVGGGIFAMPMPFLAPSLGKHSRKRMARGPRRRCVPALPDIAERTRGTEVTLRSAAAS